MKQEGGVQGREVQRGEDIGMLKCVDLESTKTSSASNLFPLNSMKASSASNACTFLPHFPSTQAALERPGAVGAGYGARSSVSSNLRNSAERQQGGGGGTYESGPNSRLGNSGSTLAGAGIEWGRV